MPRDSTTKTARSGSRSTVVAVERALEVFQAVIAEPQGAGISELAERLPISTTQIHRIMSTLADFGFVYKDAETQRYRVTTKLLGMAFAHVRTLGVYGAVLPILRKLAQETQQLAELSWVENERSFVVARAESPLTVKVVNRLGNEDDLHATATGKAWIANIPEEEASRLLRARGMAALTQRTITDLPALQRELALVRERGYAVADREWSDYVVAIAVPVFGGEPRRALGAVAVAAPAMFPIHEDHRVIELAKAAADEISRVWPFISLET
jgi:IclR family acetate operon transcriptional repressor